MYLFQTVMNVFITSGTGLAATTMPIMVPLADLLGVTRQTSVLAFQMGDGFTNMILPTSSALMGRSWTSTSVPCASGTGSPGFAETGEAAWPGAPLSTLMNRYEVVPEMEALLSIDTTKGNRIINHKGIAISPMVKEGFILRVSEDLLRVMEMTTGQLPVTFPITTQDITPYGNDLFHINSILQPSVATDAPVVGVAITAQSVVPGCGTGASHEGDIALAVKFAVEVAKEYTAGVTTFYDEAEFANLLGRYGSMKMRQTMGREE